MQPEVGKFEIYQDQAGEYRFRLKASNGQAILASEGYKMKSGCRNGIATVQKNAADDGHYERQATTAGKHMFTLKSGNHHVIGTSQMYESTSARDKGIESVKRNAADVTIDDLTL